jgi:fatty-acyl-CoA synthase
VQGDTRRTWGEFEDRAARLAAAFSAAGVGPGAVVANYLYNAPEYVEAYFAALKQRSVPVNVNYRYLDDELHYLLDNAEAEVLVFHAGLGDRVERVVSRCPALRLLVEVPDGAALHPEIAEPFDALLAAHEPAPRTTRDPDDITMTYTGGTTGLPKGVMSRVGPALDGWMAAVPPAAGLAPVSEPEEIAPAARRLAEEGRSLVAMPVCPLMHATGLAIGTLPMLTFGSCTVLLAGRTFDPDEAWATAERERVQALTLVGDAFARPLLRTLEDGPRRDLSSVRLIMSAGAMFSAEVKAGLLEHLRRSAIVDYIAATEGGMGASISTYGSPAPTGRFTPGPAVKVLTESGVEVVPGSGQAGLVAIGGTVPEGYYKDAEKTASTFRVIGGVRYSVPGDWATVEADGSIVLLGRGSQCINTGGEKVYAEEVEEAVKLHPAVRDCLVFGVPDDRFGQRVVGVVSADREAADSGDLLATARSRLSSFKVPRELVAVDRVPRGPNGKADYPRARELFAAGTRARRG